MVLPPRCLLRSARDVDEEGIANVEENEPIMRAALPVRSVTPIFGTN
jgi:hypothetical protein